MALTFIAGAFIIGAIALFVDNYAWPIAVAAYILVSIPLYGIWEWTERARDRADRETFTH
jgi:hypothetical protein